MLISFILFSDDLKRITPDSDETHINQGMKLIFRVNGLPNVCFFLRQSNAWIFLLYLKFGTCSNISERLLVPTEEAAWPSG